MKTIRWGIIGCGNVTEVKSGPGFQKAEYSQLVAVMRRDVAKARDYAARHGVPHSTGDADALINDPNVDAVYVATPPNAHEEYAVKCARAGKPVYVEKPMARTSDECRRMVDACRAANVPLFIAYYRRSLPRFLKIKELIDSGALGEIRFASVLHYLPPEPDDGNAERQPWRVKPEIAGGGRFLDLASHTLDLLDFYLGPIAKVSGTAESQAKMYPAEDIVAGHFEFASGAVGTGLWCFTSGHPGADQNEIVGSKARVRFSTFGNDPVEFISGNERQAISIPHPPHIQQPMIQAIVNHLNGVGTSPSMGESGLRTNWVMDEFLKTWRSVNRS